MLDHYLWGKCERISPEAPVQVVDINKETTVLGGAGNVINNLLTLGANVSVMSVLGRDSAGDEILEMLEKSGANFDHVIRQNGRKTSKKSRVIASHQQIIRYDLESKDDINVSSEAELYKRFQLHINQYEAILLSDYGKGVLSETLTRKIIACAKAADKMVLVDPKGSDYSKYAGATLLTPNKKEASIATKIGIVDDEHLQKAGTWLKEEIGRAHV